MSAAVSACAAKVLSDAAKRVSDAADYDPLVELAAGAQIVLIGEASHGTHEFYSTRAELTRRLTVDHGFRIVALEADWPDSLRVHRYVTGRVKERDASEALANFRRFPAWMWRNTVVLEFVEWLHKWNLARGEEDRAGLFGLDLYSMHASIESVLGYLDKVDTEAARRARHRYSCFEFFGEDPQLYGYATTRGQAESCEDEVIAQLVDLRRKHGEFMSRDGQLARNEFFYAEQNARLVANAERYYRSMFRGRDESWNLRDKHMAETLDSLINHFDGGRAKAIVWAHNSHLGDARATEMSKRGEWNVGQLAREKYGARVFSIGFTTNSGTVTAARDWGAVAERRQVRRALSGSYEDFFHTSELGSFWLNLRAENAATDLLREPRLERAIGVIYRPETERWSHYFAACLPQQFDAIIHLDETRALEPLERNSEWDEAELPDTYPEGL